MKNKNVIYGIIAAIIIAVVLIAVIAAGIISRRSDKIVTSQEAEKAEITAVKLPTDEELAAAGLEESDRAEHITSQFALGSYNIEQNRAVYNYQASEVTSGWRLTLTAEKMSEADFNSSLPPAELCQEAIFNEEVPAYFISRTINYVSSDYQIPSQLEQSVKEGKTELETGNSIQREIIPVQRMYWYKDGVGYTLESHYREYTVDDMTKLVQDFLDSNK